MPRIYLPTFTTTLPPKQAQHVKVLRLQRGDALELFDGIGHYASAKIVHIDKKSLEVDIGPIHEAAKPKTFPVHLAQSLIRSEQMDFCLQKAVELGVREITPLIAERCQGRLNPEQTSRKHLHWQEVIIAACEQSGLNFLPTLHSITALEDFIHVPQEGLQLMLDPYATHTLTDLNISPAETTLLIGPEGGFTAAEVLAAKSCGIKGIRLHEQILRAETAAIVATSTVQFYFGLK